MFSRLLIIFLLLSAVACAGLPPAGHQCQLGARCKVNGVVAIESLWQASLDQKGGCVALALPREFFARRDEFDGKQAIVVGEVFSQPADAPETFSYGYEVEGIRVNANLCKAAILVDEIRTQDGSLWTKMPR